VEWWGVEPSSFNESGEMSSEKRCTIILPVFNMEETLPRALEGAIREASPNDEVVVVDDGSTDRSAEIAARFPVRLVRHEKNRGVAAARRTGARASRGRVLFFTDADACLRPGAADRACRRLEEEPDVAALVGIYSAESGAGDLVSRFKNLWIRYSYLKGPREIDWLFGCVFAVRRSLYEELEGQVDGPRAGRWGTDIELGLRMRARGCRILLDPGLKAVHYRRHTFLGLLRNDFGRSTGYLVIGREQLGWRRLLQERRFANIREEYIVGMALLVLLAVALPASLFLPPLRWGVLGVLGVYLGFAASFYRTLYRHGGLRLGAAGIVLLAASQAASVAGVVRGVLAKRRGKLATS